MYKRDVVALIQDIPEQGLARGQVGTIVEEWQCGVYEVEFSDLDGHAYACAALPEQSLMPLWFQPVKRAA